MADSAHDKTIILCLDFDGTLTNVPGREMVNSEFYKSLQVDPGNPYTTAIFKSNLQEIFDRHFSDPNSSKDPLISESALRFLKEALKHREIQINIISRNRGDFIKAVMRHQGLTEEQISSIQFHIMKDKQKVISEMSLVRKMVLICDDSQEDHDSMRYGAVRYDADKPDAVISFRHEPGEFNWDEITKEMQLWLPESKKVMQVTRTHSHGLFDTKGKKAALGAGIGAGIGISVGFIVKDVLFKAAITALSITNPIIGIGVFAVVAAIIVGFLTYQLSNSDQKPKTG